jgi:N-hydroxyarylamine O-acetyltransferase
MPSAALTAYLDRIAWSGGTDAKLKTLAGLIRAHLQAIPFENLDVLLGWPVRLDLDAVVGKLVGARRGGYCFEHATLFAHMLEELGFRVARHSARVTLVFKRHEVGRPHMFLTVALPEGVFVVDPGFGGAAATAPVPLADAGRDSRTARPTGSRATATIGR